VNRLRIALAGSWIVLTLSGTAVADGVMRDGLGAVSCGRGGTNIAAADNGVVLLDNPAGIVNINGCGMADLGVDLLFPDLSYCDPDNNRCAADGDPYPCGNLSLIRKSCGGCWAYGVGFYAPAAFGTRYELEGPAPYVGPRLYKSFGALGKVLPAVACRVTDRLTVGGTLGVGLSHVELEGPHTLQSPGLLQGTPTLIDLQATGAALAWSLGFQYQLTPATTIGLAYQSETSFHLDGSIRVDVPDPRLRRSYFDADLDVTWPRSLGLGVRHALCPHRIVSADVIWFDWTNSFDSFDLRLTDPSNADFAVFGPIDEVLPMDWRDSVSVRVGYEHHLGCHRVLRCGYTYHRNPIPAGTLTPYLQTILEHTFSVGYGWRRGNWDINLAYQYTFGPDLEVTTSDLLGGDYDGSQHESEAHVLLLSLVRSY
jgi:long-subunit fatty acid transport protein